MKLVYFVSGQTALIVWYGGFYRGTANPFCGLPVVPRDDEAERPVDFRKITAVDVGSGAV